MRRILFFVCFLTCCTTCAVEDHYVIFLFGNHTHDNLELGIPGQADQIVDRAGYALGYSRQWKQSRWVTYRLTRAEAQATDVKRINMFKTDPYVAESATPSDYLHSGYDRGHLAPAADMHWSTNAMVESFYMSNMSPQTPSLNRDVWSRAEAFARECAIKEERVFVVSGPIVTNEFPKVIGVNHVVVPDAFYKVIYDETPPEKMVAFVMPNNEISGDIWEYATNVVYVEELTGLEFFVVLDAYKQKELKTSFNQLDWTK